MGNIGFFGGRIKCVEEILRILAALGRLRGYEPGQVGDLACQEVVRALRHALRRKWLQDVPPMLQLPRSHHSPLTRALVPDSSLA